MSTHKLFYYMWPPATAAPISPFPVCFVFILTSQLETQLIIEWCMCNLITEKKHDFKQNSDEANFWLGIVHAWRLRHNHLYFKNELTKLSSLELLYLRNKYVYCFQVLDVNPITFETLLQNWRYRWLYIQIISMLIKRKGLCQMTKVSVHKSERII